MEEREKGITFSVDIWAWRDYIPAMSKHTPGPWRIEERCIDAPDGNVALLNLARRADQTRANAVLIATAPDLLVRLRVRVRECPCVGDEDFTNQARCEECLADVAVIAKAEGR